jgi:hypothetical protein
MDYLKMNKIVLGLLGFSLLMGQAWADDVQIQLTDTVVVRHSVKTSRNAAVLISDTTLPAGSVIEITKDAFDNAQKMDYWGGTQDAQMSFVKGVKVISAPGWSKNDIDETNQLNRTDGLYVPKALIENKTHTVKKEPTKRQVWADVPIPMFYRNDSNPTNLPPPQVTKKSEAETKDQDNKKAAERVIERIGQANTTVKKAGTNDPHCDLCSKYPIKAFVSQGVPQVALMQALDFFDAHPDKIKNKNFITINDFTALSGEKRMFVLNMNTGEVEKMFVAHGKGSDAGNGRVSSFYKIGKDPSSSSYKTPAGFHLADYFWSEKHHRRTLLLDGMEARNKDSAARGIEIHGADYANDSFIAAHRYTGRSYGCPAIALDKIDHVIEELRGKSLVYNYDGE